MSDTRQQKRRAQTFNGNVGILEFLKGNGIDLEFAQPSGAGDVLQRA
jgi:hypothetical protein